MTRIFGPEWPDAPMRVIRNGALLDSESGARCDTPPAGETVLFGQRYVMPACSAVLPTRETRGDIQQMCLAAGTSVGLISGTAPAATMVRGIVRDAAAVLQHYAAALNAKGAGS